MDGSHFAPKCIVLLKLIFSLKISISIAYLQWKAGVGKEDVEGKRKLTENNGDHNWALNRVTVFSPDRLQNIIRTYSSPTGWTIFHITLSQADYCFDSN